MNITITNDRDTYRGVIVSYSLKRDGHDLDLRRIRSLSLHRDSQSGQIVLDDGTELNVFKTTFLGSKKLTLKGHFLIRLSSLGADMRFDVHNVDAIHFLADLEPPP